MSLVWYTCAGISSCLLGSILLIPDTITAIKQRKVMLSKSYLYMKAIFIINSAQYSLSVAYSFGWFASLFMSISTLMQGICLSVLLAIKHEEPELMSLL